MSRTSTNESLCGLITAQVCVDGDHREISTFLQIQFVTSNSKAQRLCWLSLPTLISKPNSCHRTPKLLKFCVDYHLQLFYLNSTCVRTPKLKLFCWLSLSILFSKPNLCPSTPELNIVVGHYFKLCSLNPTGAIELLSSTSLLVITFNFNFVL